MDIIGIDLGGTNLRAGVVKEGVLQPVVSQPLKAHGNHAEVVKQIFGVIDKIIDSDVKAIGIGVPGLVDPVSRILYNVVNIPAINETDLRGILEQRYRLPVKIENDANCFALGEFHFGAARSYKSVVGLTIGTGLGAGIITNGKLFTGKHGGAGEFGMISYLGKNIEYYVSGRFFEEVYKTAGEVVYKRAQEGDIEAGYMYEDFGRHLGEVIKLVLYVLDTECIVIGGALKAAFPFYGRSMWETVRGFPFQRAVASLKIVASVLPGSNILGAAALHLLSVKNGAVNN
ncbi:ROK family protein [Chitinophaga sp. G-6-1-13]|uniref:ROK family protein n=1 Tax=Chitinophaga fulva TaxID=2728842 RepID=A0A848GLZ9_9BACT|nr:ROK family protein [Chitinophaga fulva]NML37833.1 ROK family protein [Chitinophaga fulva]